MNTVLRARVGKPAPSEAARERLLSIAGEPLFIADWERVLMIHYEVDKDSLQAVVPFELDLNDGRAFVTIVAFTMRGMRPRRGGRIAALLLKPMATHEFLNVRTYVKSNEETGIYFLAEWLSNRLSVAFGPSLFGLPYRFGRLHYNHCWREGALNGKVWDSDSRSGFAYEARLEANAQFVECADGSLNEWLMERYTAFTRAKDKTRFFRVWHSRWLQAPLQAEVLEQALLDENWPLLSNARIIGANFSPGVREVWMGRPHRLR